MPRKTKPSPTLPGEPDASADKFARDLDTGRRLKAIREAHGWSQRELAKRAGITNSAISMVEQGQVSPSVQSLARILAAFPMDLAEFFACHWVPGAQVLFTRQEMLAAQQAGLPGVMLQTLAQSLPGRQLDITTHLLSGRAASSLYYARTGDVGGLLQEGYVDLFYGEHCEHLQPGDGFYLPQGHFYRFANITDASARLLICTKL